MTVEASMRKPANRPSRRHHLIDAAVRRLDPGRDKAHAHVNGVAMIVLYEMAVRSYLGLADPYRTLGPRRFRAELTKLSRVSTGFAGPAEPKPLSGEREIRGAFPALSIRHPPLPPH